MTYRNSAKYFFFVLFLLGTFHSNPTHAQFRYFLQTDLREQYNSDVFAGTFPTGNWDMVTEVQPGFRLYYNQPTSLWWLQYYFLFQFYSRTEDPSAHRNLLGYANNLVVEYSRLLSQRTGIRISNRFGQGTENTSIAGFATDSGALSMGFMTTGSKFFNDWLILDMEHLFTERWAIRPRVDMEYYQVYDYFTHENFIPPPTSIAVTPSNRLQYELSQHLLYLDTLFTAVREKREIYPAPLYTYLGEVGLGWRYDFTEFWGTIIGGGISFRERELFNEDTRLSSFNGTWAPVATASLRYHRGRNIDAILEYAHRYEVMLEFENATTSEVDEIAISAYWATDNWRYELGGFFRYLRAATSLTTHQETQATKLGRIEPSIAYFMRPGLSLELTYQLEIMRDRLRLDIAQPITQPPSDYTRHLVTIGVSIVWPPPPPQDARLNRRESEYEPIFTITGEGVGRQRGYENDDLDVYSRPRPQREQNRQRDQQIEQPQPDTVEPAEPIDNRPEDTDTQNQQENNEAGQE